MAIKDKNPAAPKAFAKPHPPKAKRKLDAKNAPKPGVPLAEANSDDLGQNSHPPLDAEILKQLYYSMLKARMVAALHYEDPEDGDHARVLLRKPAKTRSKKRRQDNFGGKDDLPIGREAALVGATMDLHSGDTIAPAPRSGMPLTPLKLLGAPPHIIPPASMSIATGVALAYQMRQKGRLVVALPADVDCESWHEALQFASVHQLPIIYVLENNVEPAPARRKRKTALQDLRAKAQSCGIPTITVDGNDVVACYRVNQEARLRARNGGGPTVIECRVDVAPEPRRRTRPAPARAARRKKRGTACDPLLLMQSYLDKHKLWSEEWKQKITDEIQAQIEEAVQET